MKTNSWVIIDRKTNKAVMETYNEATLSALQPQYFGVTSEKYLCEFNAALKQKREPKYI